jgi:hypothetical protein
MVLVLYIKDDRIGKCVVGNELLDAIPMKKVSSLTLFLAKLQAIKTSHRSCIEIPRSLERQYSPGAPWSGSSVLHLLLELIFILNHHASC